MADSMTNALKKALQTKLNAMIPSNFHRVKGTKPPLYAIFDFDTVTAEETVEQIELVVNVFGSGDITEPLDEKADEIWAALNHWYFNDGTLVFTTYQETRGTVVDDSNNNNLHRRLVFDIRFYD